MGRAFDRKEIELDLIASLSEAMFGHGYAHYGYWPDGKPNPPSLAALSDAQEAYVDLVADTIPAGTRTILDVGSGTGANALALHRRGFKLECLSPSERLNALARAKLPGEVKVHTTRFEDFRSDRRFDLCLFAESFHYIGLSDGLRQAERVCDGHMLIFDYFRRSGSDGNGGTRGSHAAFRQAVDDRGVFDILTDEDKTAQILPTFEVHDHVRNTHFVPLAQRMRDELRALFPLRMRMAEAVLARPLGRLERPGHRAAHFLNRFEYRIILLRRRPESRPNGAG